MALIYNTADIRPGTEGQNRALWIYCALDCMVTHEVHGEVAPQLDEDAAYIYKFSRALQAPYFQAMLRGIRVDRDEAARMLDELGALHERLESWLGQLADAIWDKPLNHRSHAQLKEFFYEVMGLPVQYNRKDGQSKVTVDVNALERLKNHYHAEPVVRTILRLREIEKLIQFLRTGIDEDNRVRCSINIGGTESGRTSTSSNPFGTGTNLQNITDRLRRILVADPGRKLAYTDLSSAESYVVGHLAQDQAYIDACETGHLHVVVSRMVWPEVEWTGDLLQDRKIAEHPFYRHFSRYDMAKRGGHLSNYGGSPWMMARHLKIEVKVAEDFQERYFDRFVGILRWHQEVAEKLQLERKLTNAFRRRRTFFGRPREQHTFKEALAWEPQSTVSDLLKHGLLKVWLKYDFGAAERVMVLLDGHDAILWQFYEDDEEIIPLVEQEMLIPITIGQTFTIPVETEIGYTWRKDSMKRAGSEEARAQVRPSTPDPLSWKI